MTRGAAKASPIVKALRTQMLREGATSGEVHDPKDNETSWQVIHEFLERYRSSKWPPAAAKLVTSLQKRQLTSHLRIGQSLMHIIISTAERHELIDEPRVTLAFSNSGKFVRVIYSHMNAHFLEGQPHRESTCKSSHAVDTVVTYLRDMWIEAKPGTPLPEGLKV